MPLLKGLAAFRPAFATHRGLAGLAGPVRISQGSEIPVVFCFPSFVGRSGAQEFMHLARGFEGVRDLSALPAPGYAAGEPLAATADALIALHAENIRTSTSGAPFVLAGYSAGGLIAHAVAAELESTGTPPEAIVLIDTYSPGQVPAEILAMLPSKVLAIIERLPDNRDDAWLTAMAHYVSLDWADPQKSAVPALLVRTRRSLSGAPVSFPPAAWDFSSHVTVVDVPGDHFTIMEDDADTTAQAVNEWLAATVQLRSLRR
jgi:thioesterase domain-containing protein